jgi:hypothetical protein
MINHYERYQKDVANTASQLVTQAVCAERGLDYNQVLHAAQQSHINGIWQQEQNRQFNQLLTRHYGGNTFFGKLKDVFSTEPANAFFPMNTGFPMGAPMMPLSPAPAMLPPAQNMAGHLNPTQVASLIGTQTQSVDTTQLQKDLDDLKNLVTNLLNKQTSPVQGSQQNQQPPIY